MKCLPAIPTLEFPPLSLVVVLVLQPPNKPQPERLLSLHQHVNSPWTTVSYHHNISCLLYTSDAADEEDSVDLGGRRIIKKKKKIIISLCCLYTINNKNS
eukprot:TRINITY_DN27769_c0_g1_i2.p1 TRINITY_DN27769_c0_g1~~TRINITY_DN27769_c0_g1_i2.p1  ORF type:complete len:100 (-),score=11.10 TRINITY_DN27769_c0_g1_i2:74-373(-)